MAMPPPADSYRGRTLPPVLLWLPVALSSMLLVLFVVVVSRQLDQARRVGQLAGQVKALEESRALERTAVLEEQLRSMLTRLQSLEKSEQKDQEIGRQLQSLQEELQVLRRSSPRGSDLPLPPRFQPDLPPRQPRPAVPAVPQQAPLEP